MSFSQKQLQEITEAADPLVKWLNENCHPHVQVVVTPVGAELLEGLLTISIEKHLKD